MQTLNNYVAVMMALVLLGACRKTGLSPCSGHCREIHITGDVSFMPGNTGMANVPVTVELNAVRCVICSPKIIGTFKTAADGKFDIAFTIDSTLLPSHYITLHVPVQEGLISIPYSTGGEVRQDYSGDNQGSYHFEFYKSAKLNLHMRRVESDSFMYFSIDHNFRPAFGFDDYVIAGSEHTPADTTLVVPTAADVYTKVVITKVFGVGNAKTITDSIKCTAQGNNTVTIDY